MCKGWCADKEVDHYRSVQMVSINRRLQTRYRNQAKRHFFPKATYLVEILSISGVLVADSLRRPGAFWSGRRQEEGVGHVELGPEFSVIGVG